MKKLPASISFLNLLQLMNGLPSRCIDVASSRDAQRNLRRHFPTGFPLLLEHVTFPAYEPPLQRWWLHWHDYYEMIVPLEGEGRFQIGDVEVPFAPGQLMLVDTLKLHGGAEVTRSHRSLVIFFPSSFVAPVGGLTADRAFLAPLASRQDGGPTVLSLKDPASEAVMETILRLAQSFYKQELTPEDRFITCKLALLQLLQLLRDRFVKAETGENLRRREQRHDRLQKVLPYLDAHCTEPITQPQIAALAGMSPSRFRAFFKETTGSTLSHYVRGLRVAQAAEWLAKTDRSLADIAAAAGFADQSHLFRCFREAMGCGPLEFRQKEQR